jgi:DNA-binding transcriptional regulator/RsmH inhibitor MraZ
MSEQYDMIEQAVKESDGVTPQSKKEKALDAANRMVYPRKVRHGLTESPKTLKEYLRAREIKNELSGEDKFPNKLKNKPTPKGKDNTRLPGDD